MREVPRPEETITAFTERLYAPAALPHFTTHNCSGNPGYSRYYAMQTRFEKRFATGYTFNVAWTWSKVAVRSGSASLCPG